MSDSDLQERLIRIFKQAQGQATSITARYHPEIYKLKLVNGEQEQIDICLRDRALEVIDTFKQAGYALPPANDLRAQLVKFGYYLKGHQFSAGYSGDGGVDDKISEAKADIISDVGRALLEALE